MFGTVATIRDRTEIESLGSELETVRTLSDALRAQTHEHANRLHTIVSLLELGRGPEALDFATKDLELSQRLTDDVVSSIEEPVLGALIMGKVAEAHERGVELDLNAGGSTGVSGLAVQDLVAILGNLLDNAIDAAAEAPAPKLVELTVANGGRALEITVEDSGPGIDPDVGGGRLPAWLQHQGAGTFRPRPRTGPGPPGGAAPRRHHDHHQPGRGAVPRHAADGGPPRRGFRRRLPAATAAGGSGRPRRDSHERDPRARRRRRAHRRARPTPPTSAGWTGSFWPDRQPTASRPCG